MRYSLILYFTYLNLIVLYCYWTRISYIMRYIWMKLADTEQIIFPDHKNCYYDLNIKFQLACASYKLVRNLNLFI